MPQTLQENLQGYTQREIARAKRARGLYHIVGGGNQDKFKNMIRSGFIHNCPVTVKDVEMANKIYGTAISHLKGKCTIKLQVLWWTKH